MVKSELRLRAANALCARHDLLVPCWSDGLTRFGVAALVDFKAALPEAAAAVLVAAVQVRSQGLVDAWVFEKLQPRDAAVVARLLWALAVGDDEVRTWLTHNEARVALAAA